MATNNPLRYCPNCLGGDYKSKDMLCPPEMSISISTAHYYIIYKGFVADDLRDKCPVCNGELIPMKLTNSEWEIIQYTSLDQDFIFAMDKLKQKDIIEFSARMAQFKETEKKEVLARIEASRPSSSTQSIPKCPTCGSTQVRKISGTKRWIGTGLFGISSSNLGKNLECLNCGAKW